MALSDLYGDVLEEFAFNTKYFAESVKATPDTGDPFTLLADVGDETTREEVRGLKRLIIRSRTFTFSTDPELDCGGIAASANLIDYKFTYPVSGGRQYSVVEVVYIHEHSKIAQVRAENVTEAEGPRPGLREGPRW